MDTNASHPPHVHSAMGSHASSSSPWAVSAPPLTCGRDSGPGARRVPSPPTRRGARLVVRGKKAKKGGGGSAVTARPSTAAYVTVAEDGSDDWRLDEIASLIREGHVGIIPTDTKYALVCDLESRAGVQTLYDLKGAGASKPMSILCRGFSDIDKYTQGFPDNVVAGRMQAFKIAKKCLPGPYTFILNAGKELPKVCLADPKSKSKNCKARKTVGVRVSGRAVTAALLSRLDRPLLSTTAPANGPLGEGESDELQDPAVMAEAFGEKLAFVVDAGVSFNPPSTVLDLSAATPTLIRRGAGDAGLWVDDDDTGAETDDEEAWGW